MPKRFTSPSQLAKAGLKALGFAAAVKIDLTLLQRLCVDGQEWFHEFDAALPGHGIRFGLHDSTALFIEGERSIAEALARAFSHVKPQFGEGT